MQNPNLVAKAKDANTWLDIATLLPPNDSDWFYDHNANPKFTFELGSVTDADCATFPSICGHSLTVALLNLSPCSMLPTSSTSTGGECRRRYVGLNNYVHDSGKWCENGNRDSHARANDHLLTRGACTTMVNNGQSHPIPLSNSRKSTLPARAQIKKQH